MPVIFTFSALITTTWSPVSRNGVYRGFSFPIRMRATCEATRPRALPEASTTYHMRAISPALGKYVDMLISQKNMKTERRPLSTRRESLFEGRLTSSRIPHTSAEGAGPPGGQPQNYPDKISEEVLACQRGRCFGDDGTEQEGAPYYL